LQFAGQDDKVSDKNEEGGGYVQEIFMAVICFHSGTASARQFSLPADIEKQQIRRYLPYP
jgi:hypothetical protein